MAAWQVRWLGRTGVIAAWLVAGTASAQLARLATAPGDGSVVFELDAYGGFGYQTYGNGSGGPGDAIYDPVGAVGPSSTTWESGVYLRMPPQSAFLTTGSIGPAPPVTTLPDPGFLLQDGTTAVSEFDLVGLEWQLTQSVEDLLVGPTRLGTLLVQRYVIHNPGPATVAFDLVRYYEGDLHLGLGAGVPDGGGRLLVGPEELLFETDLAGEPVDTTNLVGITACGGVVPPRGRYEVNAWSDFPLRIMADMPLADVVFNDGPDADQFVDPGMDYDVGIALANQFSLAPGETTAYLTTTVFGLLPPSDVSDGCALRGGAVADAGPDVAACPGAVVILDGSGSFDPDPAVGGSAESWTWDLDVTADSDADTVPDDDADRTGAMAAATFPTGTWTVRLTYVDDDGDVDTDVVTVTVADDLAPVVDCPALVEAPATSYAGGLASLGATATDDCDPLPDLRNDTTAGGADASGDYPCGLTRVTFTAMDDVGNSGSCETLVRVVPPLVEWPVGATLRVGKLPDGRPLLDWSLAGPHPPEVRWTVLREEGQRPPFTIAPGAATLDVPTWSEPGPSGPLVLYDVRTSLCDGTLSRD